MQDNTGYNGGKMETKLTLGAQAFIAELAQQGVTIQDLAPIVGRAAKFASEAGVIEIDVEHIERAAKVQEAQDD